MFNKQALLNFLFSWLFPKYGHEDLRSGHLDVKYTQCAKKYDGRKISYQIISRLGAAGDQKGRFGRLKIQLSSKVAKLGQGRLVSYASFYNSKLGSHTPDYFFRDSSMTKIYGL